MAADGAAAAEELATMSSIARALKLDLNGIERLRVQKIIGLGGTAMEKAAAEELLGIEPDWSVQDIKRFLLREFQQWNGRLNSLDAGPDRDNAQRMLDAISDARRRYA